jgi:hypothetical protein
VFVDLVFREGAANGRLLTAFKGVRDVGGFLNFGYFCGSGFECWKCGERAVYQLSYIELAVLECLKIYLVEKGFGWHR